MVVRPKGGTDGIAEYLRTGRKAEREFTRDELDERVVLEGDLDLTDSIIKSMDNEGERYLHITLAFKEDHIDESVMRSLVSDFKQFAMSAYDADEFNLYAEAHLPKIKTYTNRRTGKVVERKPHIHIVVPKHNLLSNQALDPFGLVENRLGFIDAFQEHANAKYGLASPKDNPRTTDTDESEIISRYKGDLFQGAAKDLKQRILSDMLDQKISNYDDFKTLLASYGATRSRNAGQASEYQNIKPADQAKGINLKGYVFSREFIEKTHAEKRSLLANEGRMRYEAQQAPRKTAPELIAALREWHEVGAREVKYINSGNRKLYAAYRAAGPAEKRAILADRAERHYARHQAFRGLGDTTLRTIDGKELHNERPNYSRSNGRRIRDWQRAAALYQSNLAAARRQAPPESLSSVRNLSSVRMVQHQGRAQVLLQSDASDRLGPGRRGDHAMRRSGVGPRGHTGPDRAGGGTRNAGLKNKPGDERANKTDSVVGQLHYQRQERAMQAQGNLQADMATIKRELDARRLLAHLSRTHGVSPEKYEITKGKDGGDRIKAGNRNLNVSDFLTREMSLSFNEAAPILRQVYADQQRGSEVTEPRSTPRRELWESFRKTQPEWQKQKVRARSDQSQSEKDRRAAISTAYKAEKQAIDADRTRSGKERKAHKSLAAMGKVAKDMALRQAISEERQALKDKYSQPYQARYRAYLQELANGGDENALAELRRQRDTTPRTLAAGPNSIEGVGRNPKHDQERSASLLRDMAHSIDQAGNVTYYADKAKTRAVLVDSGQRVTVATDKDTAAIEAGLRLSLQKFGPRLKIDGTKEFKKQVVAVAFKTGLRVEFENPAMNNELNKLRAEQEEHLARGQAFIATQRENAAKPDSATPAPGKTPDSQRNQQPDAPDLPNRSRDDLDR